MADEMRICIVTQFVPGQGALGGAERQCSLLAEGLSARGNDVLLLGTRGGPEDIRAGDGGYRAMSIGRVATCEKFAEVLRLHRAHVCYVRDIAAAPLAVAAARSVGVTSVVAFYSLPQCGGWDRRLLTGALLKGSAKAVRRRMADAAVERAARVCAGEADMALVQTREQQAALARHAGLRAVVAPNMQVPGVSSEKVRDSVVWVGKGFKRPEVFLDLAASLCNTAFRFVIACRLSASSPRERRLLSRIRSLPNVEHLDGAAEERLAQAYAEAVVLVNTSVVEGFPNTFLEAWAASTPVLSLAVDPDGVLSTRRLGVCCDGSKKRLREELDRLLGDEALCRAMGRDAAAYVRRVHDPDVVLPMYEELFAAARDRRAWEGESGVA